MLASRHIPHSVRFMLNNVEPIFAVGGAAMVLFNPSGYVKSTTRGLSTFNPDMQYFFTGQAGSWLYFAFVEAFVLRAVDDLMIWRLLCAGMLCSDILYCHSMAQGIGGWTTWFNLLEWTAEEWLAAVLTFPFVISRLLIVIGFWGVGKPLKRD